MRGPRSVSYRSFSELQICSQLLVFRTTFSSWAEPARQAFTCALHRMAARSMAHRCCSPFGPRRSGSARRLGTQSTGILLEVIGRVFRGIYHAYQLKLTGRHEVMIAYRQGAAAEFDIGRNVHVTWSPDDVVVLERVRLPSWPCDCSAIRFCSGLTCVGQLRKDRTNKEKSNGEDVQASFSRRHGRFRDGDGRARSGPESFEHHGDFVRRGLGDLNPGGGCSGSSRSEPTSKRTCSWVARRQWMAQIEANRAKPPIDILVNVPDLALVAGRSGLVVKGFGAARTQSRGRAPQLHRNRREELPSP